MRSVAHKFFAFLLVFALFHLCGGVSLAQDFRVLKKQDQQGDNREAGVGGGRSETSEPAERGMRQPRKTQEELQHDAAQSAITSARVDLVTLGTDDPSMLDDARYSKAQDLVIEAESALLSRNFALAMEKATLARRRVAEIRESLEELPEDWLSRQLAQAFKKRKPSSIEEAFAEEAFAPGAGEPGVVSRQLEQFGYDLFRLPTSSFAPILDVPVGPDYIVGPDDTLNIRMWGLVDSDHDATVDREGKIFLPKVGAIPIAGLTFMEAKGLIQRRLSQFYRQYESDITLGRLRTIKVYVVGDVTRPGGYALSSLSTVSNALYAAGGPTKSGTMRNIKLIRNNQMVGTIDFYRYLLKGDKSQDYGLQSGDTVFVPPISRVVAVSGQVKRPAIYELNGRIRLSEAIDMAGGTTPLGYLGRVQIERIEEHREKTLIDVDLTSLHGETGVAEDRLLQDGDFVKVFQIFPKIYDAVVVDGFARYAGTYALKPGMRISSLVTPQMLMPETNLDHAEVIRVNQRTRRSEVISFVPRLLLDGDLTQDMPLQPEDTVVLYSETRKLERVMLTGEFMRPGIYTITRGERLSEVIRRAGGFTVEAYPKAAVFIREGVKERQTEQMRKLTTRQRQRMVAEQAAFAAGAASTGVLSTEATTQALAGEERALQETLALVDLGRLVVRVDHPERLEGAPEDIMLQDGDALHVPQKPASVAVLGSVKNPTALLHEEGQRLDYYIQQVGGLSDDADKKELYILRANGESVSDRLNQYALEPGDAVVVPSKVEAKVQPLPFWSAIMTIVGSTATTLALIIIAF